MSNSFEVITGQPLSPRIAKEEFRVSVSNNGINWNSIAIPRNLEDVDKVLNHLRGLRRELTKEKNQQPKPIKDETFKEMNLVTQPQGMADYREFQLTTITTRTYVEEPKVNDDAISGFIEHLLKVSDKLIIDGVEYPKGLMT